MNDVTLAIVGFKNNNIYYTDTDSMNIHNNDFDLKKGKD